MDEARLQAYVNLIEQFFVCANEEEFNNILQANQELIDPEFLQVMENYATWLEQQGNNNPAAWLRDMAQQLGQYLNSQAVNSSEYQGFLLEVLQAEAESNDPAVVYPILQRRQYLLNDTFAQLLQQWARNLFSQGNAEEVAGVAVVIQKLCVGISQFPRGSRANNLEIAITGYQTLLEVYTREAFPEDWAMTQNNLANAYLDRIRGDKAENLEQAIAGYTEALKVRTFEVFPQDWAMTQNNLASAYVDRIRGDKAENLEQAISYYTEVFKVRTFNVFPQLWADTNNNLANAYFYRVRGNKAENLEIAIAGYTEALKVRTFGAFPQDWADTQHNLSNAYLERIRGDKAENLEQAIAGYTEALKVRTFGIFPQDWAATQNNLASAYLARIRGDKAENLEQAITYYIEALKVRTFGAFPQNWAMTQNNLANAYVERIKGDKAENLEIAITCYIEALKVYTFDSFPQDWAVTQNNLALAYVERIKGDKAENLELAITGFTEALKVRTFDSFSQNWAMTQNNLANAYFERIKGDEAENLELAITGYTEALKVYTFDAFPQDWAGTHDNLAVAYSKRVKGNKSENLELAISFFHNALEIRTKEDNPLNCLQTARNLGIVHYNEKQWELATQAYHTAIEAAENSRLEALNPQSRQEVLSNAINVFHRIIQAHLNLHQPEKALEYIERSKARNLVELMTQKNLKPQGVSQTIIDEYDHLRQQVVNEQIRLQHQSINQNLSRTDNLMPYVQDHSYLKEYQQQLDTFIEQQITPIDPTFKLTQKVEPITFAEIQNLTEPATCLLQWYITSEKILAFIVSSDGKVNLWQSTETDLQTFIETADNYLQLYYSENGKQEWIKQLPNLLQSFSQTLHLSEIINLIPSTCQRLTIIPHRFLHILPIHAFPISENKVLQDKYTVQYAPSCQLLQRIQQSQQNELTHLLAIQNPTEDRPFVDFGIEAIRHLFSPHDYVLSGNQATKDNLLKDNKLTTTNCFHFFGHGQYNPNSPLESALILANNQSLTLNEIFDLRLEKCRLVILSACETGISDIYTLSDEYIGLPSGFLFTGSPNVISTLWVVDSVSTAFLIIELYQNLSQQSKQNQIDVTIALKQAQQNLKTMTNEQFRQRLEQHKPQLDEIFNRLSTREQMEIEAMLQYRQSKPYPFNHPFDWAAFVSIGQ